MIFLPRILATFLLLATWVTTHLLALTTPQACLGHLFIFKPVGILIHVVIGILSIDSRGPLLFELAKLFLAALQLPLQMLLLCQKPALLVHAGLVLQLQLPQLGLQLFDLWVVEPVTHSLAYAAHLGPAWGRCLGNVPAGARGGRQNILTESVDSGTRLPGFMSQPHLMTLDSYENREKTSNCGKRASKAVLQRTLPSLEAPGGLHLK